MSIARAIPLTCCGLPLLCGSQQALADHFTTKMVQGAGQNWNAAIWQLNGAGASVAPAAGNTYEAVFNGTAFGNNTANTRLRNPASAGVQTFPGAWLKMGANTEIRMKTAGAILNFPGVDGNPGLILDGGILNAGDDTLFEVRGKIRVDSQSYMAPGDNGGGALKTARGFRIMGELSGSATMVLFQAATNVAQQIGGEANTFSGKWIVKAGRLLGSAPGSLGTNNITVDPNYVLPLDPGIMDIPGPAVLEAGYDLNSAGALTLVNGGALLLHQNIYFTSASIEGTPLSPGKHAYSELLAGFPGNILEGGSGSITVQPYVAINPPGILIPPAPQRVYAGRTARFTVAASGLGDLTYKWRKNGAFLADGGNISGATNAALVVSNVSAADAASYDVVVGNAGGSVTSATATLGVQSLGGDAYETALLAANPWAIYRLDEAPATTTAFDYAGGYAGVYGPGAQSGAAGAALAGFPAGNKGAAFANTMAGSRIGVTPWNLNTNTATLLAWVNPSGPQAPNAGIIHTRGGGATAGLAFTGTMDLNGNYPLGYTWNNEWETYTWNSGLVPPANKWSLVALVVTPTNATIHLMNDAAAASAIRAWAHVSQSFAGTTLIGGDSLDNDTGARSFSGTIDDVSVFNRALSRSEILALYAAGSGAASFPVSILVQPESVMLYQGQTAAFTVVAGGPEPLSYQWQFGGVHLSDNARISGANTPRLTVRNITAADGGEYTVRVSSGANSASSVPAYLTVNPTLPAENITMAVQQAAGFDWDNAIDWSDFQAATDSAAQKPGSTYELLPGSRMRTPQNPSRAVFPGDVLMLQGNGMWTNNPPAAHTDIAEIRLKQPNPGSIYFKKLVMNGGQIDTGNDNVAVIQGQMDIRAKAPIYNDGTADRGLRLDAWITGAGSIEYHGYNSTVYNPNYANNLNITGLSNTFSGTWNVVSGTLLGTGPGALGTNDITVGPGGALEATYDINNPNGSLFLGGRMFLHGDHTFQSVLVNGQTLAPGTHTFAELSAAFTNNFPAVWKPQTGAEAFSSGSGSITVLGFAAPSITLQPVSRALFVGQTAQFTVAALGSEPMSYQWRSGANGVYANLADGGRISGATTTNLIIANLATGDTADYIVVITNPGGASASLPAKLTVQPTGPAEHITISAQQPPGVDWDNGADWSDGLPASISAAGKPGSTYEVLPGARLRSTDNAADAVFPGDVLTVSGDGVWVNNASPTLGEIRFKQASNGSVAFKKLVLNGGQLDTGNDGLVSLLGHIDVAADSTFNNNSSNDRGFNLAGWLTGSGDIEYHAYQTTFMPAFVNGLIVSGTSNTYSGKWTVAAGILMGAAPKALGTNDITVAMDGALETTYDLKNYRATLTLDGQMFLHQDDIFGRIIIGGMELAEGTYTFAQLNSLYPNNFPATWSPHTAAQGFTTGSGSLAVWGGKPLPPEAIKLKYEYTSAGLKLMWDQGRLLEGPTPNGPWLESPAASPYTVPTTAPERFYRVQVQ